MCKLLYIHLYSEMDCHAVHDGLAKNSGPEMLHVNNTLYYIQQLMSSKQALPLHNMNIN